MIFGFTVTGEGVAVTGGAAVGVVPGGGVDVGAEVGMGVGFVDSLFKA